MATIIIVEDEAIVALDYKITLTKKGHNIVGIYASSKSVLQALQKNIPDLLLVDLNLKGGKDGIELVNEIRKFSNVPVLFLSGNSDPKTLDRVAAISFSRFLTKPAIPHVLINEVEKSMHTDSQRLR